MEGRVGHAAGQLHDAPRGPILKGDLVDGGQQRQLVAEIVLLHHGPNLLPLFPNLNPEVIIEDGSQF